MKRGFTLIELMIVVAIIGILAAIAIPQFANLIRKSAEGQTKGNLASLRSAVTIYYTDMEGQYPGELVGLTVGGKYLGAIPVAKLPNYHPDSSSVLDAAWGSTDDSGGWQYNNLTGFPNQGAVWVNCAHTDTKGSIWTTY